MTEPHPLDVPEFLKLTAEQRRKAWEANPPKPSTAQVEQNNLRQLQIAADKERKREKLKMFLAKRKEREQLQSIPKSKRRWDVAQCKWVHDAQD